MNTDIRTELNAIAAKYGNPEPDRSGPSWQARAPYCRATEDSVGGWDGTESQVARDYNDMMDELCERADVRHTGGDCYVTSYNPGSPEWQACREEMLETIGAWAASDAWEWFCESRN